MTELSDKDLRRLSDAIMRGMAPALANAMRQSPGSSASPGRSSTDKTKQQNNKAVSENTDALDDSTEQIDAFAKKMKESGKAVSTVMNIQAKAVSRSLKKFELGADGSTEQLNDLIAKSSALTRSMFESTGAFDALSNESLDKFSGKLNKTVRSMVAGNDLLESMIKTNSGGDGAQGMRDFQNNLERLGKTSIKLNQAMEMAKVKRLQDMDGSQQHADILKMVVPELKKLGVVTEDLEKDLYSNNAAVRKAALAHLDNAATTARDTVAKTASIAATKANFASLRKTLGEQVLGFTGMHHEMATVTAAFTSTAGALALITSGLKGLYSQFMQLGSAGLGGAIIDLNKLGFSALLSATALGDLVTANKQLMGQAGLAGFTKMLTSNAKELREHGLSSEEAAKANAAFAQTVGAAGVSLNDPKFSQALSDQKDAFIKLRAVTGVTAEQFAALTQDLMNTHDMQVSMARMTAAERVTKLRGINAEMQRLTMMGVSLEQSKKIIAANEALLGQTVKNRLEQAAKFQQAASIAGKGAEGAEAAMIMRKGRRATEEEKARLSDINASVRGSLDQMAGQGGLGTENMIDAIDEGLGGPSKDLADATRDMRRAVEEMKGTSSKQLADSIGLGKSELGGSIRAIMDGIGVFFGNPLIQLAGGILGLLSVAWLSSKQLGKITVAVNDLVKPVVDTVTAAKDQTQQVTKASSGVRSAILRSNEILAQIHLAVSGKAPKGGKKKSGGSSAPSRRSSNTPINIPDGLSHPDAPSAGGSARGAAKTGGAFGKLGGIIGKMALPLLAVNSLIDAAGGWMAAGETFATDAPTAGQKISGALGSVLSGLSMGLLDGASIATGIYDTAGWIGEQFTGAFNFLQDLFENYILGKVKIIGSVIGAIKGFFGFSEDNAFSDLAKEKEKEYAANKELRDGELKNSKAERQQAKAVRDSAKKTGDENKSTASAVDYLHKTTLDSMSGASLVNEVATSQAANLQATQASINNSTSNTAKTQANKPDNASDTSSTSTSKTITSSTIASDPNAILASILEKITELVVVNTEMKDTDSEALRQMRKLAGSSNAAPSKTWVLQNA